MQILLEVQDVNNASPFGKDSTGNELALVSIEPSRSSVTIVGGLQCQMAIQLDIALIYIREML